MIFMLGQDFDKLWNVFSLFRLVWPFLLLRYYKSWLSMWKSVVGRKKASRENKPDDFYSRSRKTPFIHEKSSDSLHPAASIFTSHTEPRKSTRLLLTFLHV